MAKKILVVDDSRTVRLEVRAALAPAGYEIVEAADGIEGSRRITGSTDLAMIICDVNMPNMNGIEMLTAVRGQTRPILMMTTEGSAKLIREAQQAGATAWIVKPFKPEQLLSAVGRLAGAAN